MSPQLAFALEATYQAGRSTLAYFGSKLLVERKADQSPVTKADLQAEQLLRAAIQKAYPNDSILGEEGEDVQRSSNARWIIDPIDGTRSFVAGVPLYATLLSLEVGGDVQLGVCYFPALDEMLYAEKGQGAYINGRKCQVSTRSTMGDAIICHAGICSFRKTNLLEGLLKVAEQVEVMRTWCDAYGHALVVQGQVDAMLDPVVSPWDISAMSLITREAGGRFTDFKGHETLAETAISSNGLLHERILEAFRL
jgi:myo-inositol-1(or 4)-monophosphatase